MRGKSPMSRGWAAVVIAVTVAATSLVAGFLSTFVRQPQARADTGLTLIWETWAYVERYFYGEIPEDNLLVYGIIDGALDSLADPYTRLVRPVANSLDQDRLRGVFGGIGVAVYECGEGLCLRPLPDTPASRAGMLEGDRLIAVDGKPLPDGGDIALANTWLRGEVGSHVVVSIVRPPPARPPVPLTLRRCRASVSTACWKERPPWSAMCHQPVRGEDGG